MNLFEALALVLLLVGVVVGAIAAASSGWLAAAWGALKGAAFAFGVYVAIMFGVMTLLALGLLWRPPFPRCREGRCTGKDYRYLSMEAEQPFGAVPGVSAGGVLAQCRCGTRYLRRTAEGRVWQVAADGTLVPYMRHSPLGRWRKDLAPP
jgi:hypothetical protein